MLGQASCLAKDNVTKWKIEKGFSNEALLFYRLGINAMFMRNRPAHA
jgi:hypothetical protein